LEPLGVLIAPQTRMVSAMPVTAAGTLGTLSFKLARKIAVKLS
jgi:hypothetical protein